MGKTIEVDLNLLPHQRKFLELDCRFPGFISGRGAGKTFVGILWVLMRALDQPDTYHLIGAPTYRTIKDTVLPSLFKLVESELKCPEIIESMNNSDMVMELYNHSKILFRPLSNKEKADRTGRGPNLTTALIEEGAQVSKYSFDVVRGTLRGGENAKMGVVTTPKGFNHIYDMWIDNDDPEYKAVTGISTEDNIFLPNDFVEDLRSGYSGAFLEQEFYGKFVKFEGLVFNEFDPDNHIVDDGFVDKIKPSVYIWGYDSGHTNPRVYLKIGVANGVYVVLDEWYNKKWLLTSSISQMERVIGSDVLFADPSAKSDIEEMKKEGIRAVGGDNDVSGGIEKVNGLFKNDRLFIHERCENLRNELLSYQWADGRDEPIKEFDHAVDSLRYAVYTHDNKKGGGFGKFSTSSFANSNRRGGSVRDEINDAKGKLRTRKI